MKFSVIGTALFLAVMALDMAAQSVYLNTQNATAPDQIDATIFINRGTFTADRTLLPYDFQNTLVFTNKGLMDGVLSGGGGFGFFASVFAGYRFDYTDSLGVRRPSQIFFNSDAGKVDLGTEVADLTQLGSFPTLDIRATNIVSRGELSASAIGVIRLTGDHVDLREGLINVRPLLSGSASSSTNDFNPDVALQDVAWGIGEVGVKLSSFVTITTKTAPTKLPFLASALTPRYIETNVAGREFRDIIAIPSTPIDPAPAHFFINKLSESNQFVQGVILRITDPTIQSKVTFHNVELPDDPYGRVLVDVFTTERNEITGVLDERHLYILDDLAKGLTPVFLTNLNTLNTFRPSNFDVRRSRPPGLDKGSISNAPVVPVDLFTKYFNKAYPSGLDYTNKTVTNIYSAYHVRVSDPTDSSTGTGFTDASLGALQYSGRVEIDANVLDMTHTRIRAEGAVSIKANHLLNLDSAFIDSPRLYYDIGTTNEVLDLKPLSKKQVTRLDGNVRMFSTQWTNFVEVTITNPPVAAAASVPRGAKLASNGEGEGGGGTTEGTTETLHFETGFHVLVVDIGLTALQPVDVKSLTTHAKHVTIPDNVAISGSLLMDATDLTIGGDFSAPEFSSVTNFPNLTLLTNKGSIFTGSRDIHLGDQGSPKMEVIQNSGQIIASGQFYKTDRFVNRGFMTNSGQQEIGIESKTLIMENGTMGSMGEVMLKTEDFVTLDNTLVSGSFLTMDISSSVTDTVARRGSTISAGRGITLVRKPQRGDFMATRVQLALPALYRSATLNWAGSDVGVNVTGFTNNAAVGILSLRGDTGARFDVTGSSGPGAIYVDLLDIGTNMLKELDSFLNIAPNFTIYYAAATNVLAEVLDGKLDGRLRWVSAYLGPYSTVEVALESGEVVKVNKGVAESLKLDYDGDGIPNGLDPSPFERPVVKIDSISVVNKPPRTAIVVWTAAPVSSYILESISTLKSTNWVTVKSIFNPATAPAPLSVEDVVPPSSTEKYYRLRLVLP